MKRVMILSAGTTTAWSFGCAIKSLNDNTKLLVCDTNSRELVHTSVLADEYYQVPSIKSSGYYEYMLELFRKAQVDILVPLIDWDLLLFAQDNPDLMKMGILSTAPLRKTFEALSNKRNMTTALRDIQVKVPKLFLPTELNIEDVYYVKPEIGFGSREACAMTGKEIVNTNLNGMVIQELCTPEEITADVFFDGYNIQCICRQRIEVKAGVCTKARIFLDEHISKTIEKVAQQFNLPYANCVQFMRSQEGEWLLTDFNLRLGAGSALSAAVGFKVAFSAVALWLGKLEAISIIVPQEEHFVVRYYKEIVTI